MEDSAKTDAIYPGGKTRLLLAASLLWGLGDVLTIATWRASTFGASEVFFPYPYTFHILLAPYWAILIQYSLIALITVIWLRRGGLWGLLLILVNSTIADQNLPVGWGPLASHPAILLCVIWDLGSGTLRRYFHWIFLAQVSFMYLLSVSSKNFKFWLTSPGAVATTLKGQIITTDAGRWLGGVLPDGVGVGLDALVIGLQLSVIFLWVLPRKRGASIFVLSALCLFHVVSAVALRIIPFALACLAILSMGLPQRPFRELKPQPWISFAGLAVWILGMVAAAFWIWVPGLQDLSLRQSWRIMQKPDQTKPVRYLVRRNGRSFLPEETFSATVLSQGMNQNLKVRTYFGRSLCQTKADKVEVLLQRGEDVIRDNLDCSLPLQ